MRVVLVGCGVGGLTAALMLARRSIQAVVLERSPVLGEVGAGVQLSPNATRLLFDLGLEAPLRAAAFAPEAVEVREHLSGALLLRTALGVEAERRWGAPYLQVHRADLQRILLDAVRAAGVRIRLAAEVVGIEPDGEVVQARLATGERVAGEALAGCDGVRSAVRAALWGEQAARFTGQLAWRGLVDAARLDGAASAREARVWTGAGRHFVHYPVQGGARVNFVGVVARRDWRGESWTAPGDLAELRRDFQGWPEPVARIATVAKETWRYALHDRAPLARWSWGRATLLGDAAHPAPPFLAQGAAMAVEDAEALARHLAAARPVEASLFAYEQERRPRTSRVQAWSRRNAALFHLPGALARPLFAAVQAGDRLRGEAAEARLDWLYGHRPPAGLLRA